MSYSIYLCDAVTGNVLHSDTKHQIKGGTYAVGGTDELWIDVTTNYYKIFCMPEVFGSVGIHFLNNKMAADTIKPLEKAIQNLKDDTDPDYWKPTEGNAKSALISLLALAKLRPDGIWSVLC